MARLNQEDFVNLHFDLSARTMVKKRLYFDMYNVLVDFASGIARLDEATKKEYEGRLDEVPGIFALMDPMSGAINAVQRLSEKYDVYILRHHGKILLPGRTRFALSTSISRMCSISV